MRNFSSKQFNSYRKEEKVENDKRYEEKQVEIDLCKLRWSILHLGLGDYFCIMRKSSFFLTKKHKQR